MLTVADIISLAEIQTNESYDDPTWIKFINAAINDLTPIAKMLKSKNSIVATLVGGAANIAMLTDTDLAKAQEILHVYFTPTSGERRQLRRLSVQDIYSEGWMVDSDNLYIQNAGTVSGTIDVNYYKILLPVSATTDSLNIPEQYYNLIVLYVCAKSQQVEEELNDKNDFYAEYMFGKMNFAIDRLKMMEPHKRKLIRELERKQLGLA